MTVGGGTGPESVSAMVSLTLLQAWDWPKPSWGGRAGAVVVRVEKQELRTLVPGDSLCPGEDGSGASWAPLDRAGAEANMPWVGPRSLRLT